jgi:hypothetical protein
MSDLQQQQHAHDQERILRDLFDSDAEEIGIALSSWHRDRAEQLFVELSSLIERLKPHEIAQYLDELQRRLASIRSALARSERAMQPLDTKSAGR